jgi:hypothetical protein
LWLLHSDPRTPLNSIIDNSLLFIIYNYLLTEQGQGQERERELERVRVQEQAQGQEQVQVP